MPRKKSNNMQLNTDTNIRRAAQHAINNTEKKDVIRQRMEAYGVDAAHLNRGKSLLAKAEACTADKDRCYQAQWETSQQIKVQLEAVEPQTRDHIQVVRTAYRHEPEVVRELRIDSLARSGWLSVAQAEYFYEKLRQRKISLASYGISDADVRKAATEIRGLLTLREERAVQKAEAEHCTEAKQAAYKALHKWVSEFRAIARIAFRDEPQWLEAFGMVARSAV